MLFNGTEVNPMGADELLDEGSDELDIVLP